MCEVYVMTLHLVGALHLMYQIVLVTFSFNDLNHLYMLFIFIKFFITLY